MAANDPHTRNWITVKHGEQITEIPPKSLEAFRRRGWVPMTETGEGTAPGPNPPDQADEATEATAQDPHDPQAIAAAPSSRLESPDAAARTRSF